jgi:hypothetical protein
LRYRAYWKRTFLAGGLLVLSAGFLQAQQGAGIRAGASVDPDQFYFGGHVALGPLVERLWFRPNLEIGIGNDRTTVALNGEFTYWFPQFRNSQWSPYVGAGPALNLIRLDEDRFGERDTEAEGGFNILLGLGHQSGLFAEFKVGALHSPDIKIGVGYSFR